MSSVWRVAFTFWLWSFCSKVTGLYLFALYRHNSIDVRTELRISWLVDLSFKLWATCLLSFSDSGHRMKIKEWQNDTARPVEEPTGQTHRRPTEQEGLLLWAPWGHDVTSTHALEGTMEGRAIKQADDPGRCVERPGCKRGGTGLEVMIAKKIRLALT